VDQGSRRLLVGNQFGLTSARLLVDTKGSVTTAASSAKRAAATADENGGSDLEFHDVYPL
jgi:hypothetical protein